MKLKQTIDTGSYSRLSEIMGDAYTESDAELFAEYLIGLCIEDTDEISDYEWAELLADWEEEKNEQF